MALSTSDLRSILAVLAIGSLVLGTAEASVVRRIAELEEFNDVPGVTQIPLSGSKIGGNETVQVWMITSAPGFKTPIHRHKVEEVIIITKGGGMAYIAPDSENDFPGEPEAFPLSANSTFSIPVNAVHQIVNTHDEDMQGFAIRSSPRVMLYVYEDWNTRHEDATPVPLEWDKPEPEEATSTKDEL